MSSSSSTTCFLISNYQESFIMVQISDPDVGIYNMHATESSFYILASSSSYSSPFIIIDELKS